MLRSGLFAVVAAIALCFTGNATAQPRNSTIIMTINGVGFDPGAADDFVLPLQKLLHERLNWQNLSSPTSQHVLRWFDNPSAKSNVDPGLACYLSARALNPALLVFNAFQSCPESGVLSDLAESSRLLSADFRDDVSEQVSARAEEYIKTTSKVLIVAHSQGNLYARATAQDISRPECLAIISIATPTDKDWNSKVFRKSVVVEGSSVRDIILATGEQNTSTTRLKSSLSDSLDAAVAVATSSSIKQLRRSAGMYALHGIRTYLEDPRTASWIADAIRQADERLATQCVAK
jgi:predicted alpha/beta hydrolase family esterase